MTWVFFVDTIMFSFPFKVYSDLTGEKGFDNINEKDLFIYLVKCKFPLNCTINVFEDRKSTII